MEAWPACCGADCTPAAAARCASRAPLQGHLDAALRASSVAGEDPGLLRRVDVRLPPGKALEGDTGWDVFSLQVGWEGAWEAGAAVAQLRSCADRAAVQL